MIKKITYTLIIFFSCSFISCSNLHNENNIKEQDISTIEDIEIINKQENITMEYILDNLTSDEFEGRFTGSNGNKLAEQFIEDIFNNIELDKVFNTDNYKHTYIQEISDTPGLQNADSKTEFKEINNIIIKFIKYKAKRISLSTNHIRGWIQHFSNASSRIKPKYFSNIISCVKFTIIWIHCKRLLI